MDHASLNRDLMLGLVAVKQKFLSGDHPVTKQIKIVSTAPGTVWLDDVQVERIVD